MIKERKGNLLQADTPMIAHQVNCQGVMGADIARQIRKDLLTAGQYREYQQLCKKNRESLLGACYLTQKKDTLRYVAHLFAENIPTGKGLDTEYSALRQSLTSMMFLAAKEGVSQIAIPGYLGCGLAGGDWEVVYSEILVPLFSKSCFTLTILYLPGSIRRLWEEFGEIPMDPETECIEQSWHGFPSGTHREKIWHWFEETFQISVAEALMYANNKRKL